MAEMCETCGLPDDLCVCEEMDADGTRVKVETDTRTHNHVVTVVEGVDRELENEDLASELQSKLACGGTFKEGRIELQGDHGNRVKDILEDKGFVVQLNEN